VGGGVNRRCVETGGYTVLSVWRFVIISLSCEEEFAINEIMALAKKACTGRVHGKTVCKA